MIAYAYRNMSEPQHVVLLIISILLILAFSLWVNWQVNAQQANLGSNRFMVKFAVSFHPRGHVLHMGEVLLFPVHINLVLSGRPGHLSPPGFQSLLAYGCSGRGHQHSHCLSGVKGEWKPAAGGDECPDDRNFPYLNDSRLPQLDMLGCSLCCYDL